MPATVARLQSTPHAAHAPETQKKKFARAPISWRCLYCSLKAVIRLALACYHTLNAYAVPPEPWTTTPSFSTPGQAASSLVTEESIVSTRAGLRTMFKSLAREAAVVKRVRASIARPWLKVAIHGGPVLQMRWSRYGWWCFVSLLCTFKIRIKT
jgi:hypothetical protein